MDQLGEGATGVIFGARAKGTGHFFQVKYQSGVIQFVDGQLKIGERLMNPQTFMQTYKFEFLLFKNTTGIAPKHIKW